MTASPQACAICIPPSILDHARAVAEEGFTTWQKLRRHGNHHAVICDSLEDVEEVADWASMMIEEPAAPLKRSQRQAFLAVLGRAHRFAVLEPLGAGHFIAVRWRPAQPRLSNKQR
jgi:hypothetical protein